MNRESDAPFDDSAQPYRAPSAQRLPMAFRLFGPQRYRAVPWTVWEVILIVPMVVSGIWHGLLLRAKVQSDAAFAAFNQLAVLLVLALPFMVVVFRQAKLYQLGLHTSHCWRNAWAGFVFYFVAAPVVTFTNLCALQFFERTPHKIEESLTESPTVANFALSALAAVVIAPVLEELTFRGILLPWLRRVLGPWPAILLSSAVFAIAHCDAWPSPIPLFVLALFLGFLAHRTTSLLGPVVLHATFNAANMAILIVAIIRKAVPFD